MKFYFVAYFVSRQMGRRSDKSKQKKNKVNFQHVVKLCHGLLTLLVHSLKMIVVEINHKHFEENLRRYVIYKRCMNECIAYSQDLITFFAIDQNMEENHIRPNRHQQVLHRENDIEVTQNP